MELSNLIGHYYGLVDDCEMRIHDIKNGEYEGDDDMYDFMMARLNIIKESHQKFLDALLACEKVMFTEKDIEKAYNDGRYHEIGDKFNIELYRKK